MGLLDGVASGIGGLLGGVTQAAGGILGGAANAVGNAMPSADANGFLPSGYFAPDTTSKMMLLAGLARDASTPGAAGEGMANAQQAIMNRYMLPQQMAMQQMRIRAISQLPQDQQVAALLNPDKFAEEYSKRFAPTVANADQRVVTDAQTVNSAPGTFSVDGPSGRPINNMTGATLPTLGGDYDPATGVSKRTAQQVPVATWNVVNKGQHGSYTAPPIAGMAMGPSGAPQLTGSPISGPSALPTQGAPPAPQASGNGIDPRAVFNAFTLPHEGTALNPSDLNGAPVRYGVNAKANPGVDLSKLTPDGAADIFAKYWQQSGADKLPAALAPIQAETAWTFGPGAANQFLRQSGGDPQKYLALRQARFNQLAAASPQAAQYLPAWTKRNADLATFAANAGQPAQQGQGAALPSSLDGGGVSPPQEIPGLPGKWQVQPDGTMSHLDGTGMTPKDAMEMGKAVREDKSYLAAQEAGRAFQSMLQLAAQKPGGMRAYALRDTFARTINPGAVARVGTIEAIKQAQGVPAQVAAFFSNLKGDGDVPPEIVQQIIGASAPFAQNAWEQANALNQRYAAVAKKNGLDPDLATAPMDPAPIPTVQTPAEAAKLPQGAPFRTPDGRVLYNRRRTNGR